MSADLLAQDALFLLDQFCLAFVIPGSSLFLSCSIAFFFGISFLFPVGCPQNGV